SVAIDMAIETSDAFHAVWVRCFAIVGGVELLLRELGYEQPHALHVLCVEDSLKNILEILNGYDSALRNVAQIGPRGEEHGGRKFWQKVFRQVEVDVEAFEPRELLDLMLREYHAAHGMIRMRQRQISLGEHALVLDFVRRNLGKFLPR